MNIIKKVVIKQVVTEKSKEKIYRNFHDHKLRLEQECQQLLFEKENCRIKLVVQSKKLNNVSSKK